MPKVSIIIPIYNVEKYLRECLNSVINQTLKDIEIICIDDGSPDNCPQIVDEYAQKDNRVIVIHKENGGYASAINKGFDIANGEYIGIVESDDFCEESMFLDLYNKIKDTDADFVMSDFYKYNNKTKENKLFTYSKYIDLDENKAFNLFECPKIISKVGFPWKNLYRKTFIEKNNIRLIQDGNGSYEDIVLNVLLFSCAKNVLYLNKPLYHYRVTHEEASSSNGKRSMINYLIRRKQAREVLIKRDLYKNDIKEYFAETSVGGSISFFKRISNEYKEEFYYKMRDFFEILKNDGIMCNYFSLTKKEHFYSVLNKEYNQYQRWLKWKEFNKKFLGVHKTDERITITLLGIKIKLKRRQYAKS